MERQSYYPGNLSLLRCLEKTIQGMSEKLAAKEIQTSGHLAKRIEEKQKAKKQKSKKSLCSRETLAVKARIDLVNGGWY